VLTVSWASGGDGDERVALGDPLGFRSYADRIGGRLVPVLTPGTSRVRGFSLLCLGVQQAQQAADAVGARARLARLEAIWLVAEAHRAVADPMPGGPPFHAARVNHPLDRPGRDRQLRAGVWGTYRRAGVAFGLLAPFAGRAEVEAARLTPRGAALAAAFRAAGLPPRARLGNWLQQDSVATTVLARMQVGTGAGADEAGPVGGGMASFDAHHGRELGRLRAAFDAAGSLALEEIPPPPLTDGQRQALREARALVEVVRAVEAPYRDWLATGEGSLPTEVWELDGWRLAAAAGEHGLERLHARGSAAAAGDALPAVHRHQRWLAAGRGAPAWEVGEGEHVVTDPERLDPDVALGAAERLFREGVDPGAGG
jgi:hypothetical protein